MVDEETSVPVGVLCKDDILKLANELGLISGFQDGYLQSCSYDLTIGTIFRDGQIINKLHNKAEERITIQPGEIVSVLTLEELKLPCDVAATAFGINAQSREGLMVLNPGHIDPGFEGPLSIKAINLRKVPLSIGRKDKIFTVIFERLPKKTKGFDRNIPRAERERQYNKQDLEVSPKGLVEIVKISGDCPFALKEDVKTFKTEAEVKDIVLKHWMSWLTLALAAVAAIASLYVVFRGNSERVVEHRYYNERIQEAPQETMVLQNENDSIKNENLSESESKSKEDGGSLADPSK